MKTISFLALASIEYPVYISLLLSVHPMIIVIFTLSSISSGLEFWSVNYASMNENFVLVNVV